MKLRETVKKQIRDELDRTLFTSEDFDIEYRNMKSDTSMVFELNFKHLNNCLYRVNTLSGNRFNIIQSPGEFEVTSIYTERNFEAVLKRIHSWSTEIREELAALKPEFREIDKLKEQISEAITSSIKDNDIEFSVSEINELKRKFNELEKRISDLEENEQITESQKEQMSSSIEQVSKDLEIYPKDTWVKTSVNKLAKCFSAAATSKEGRALMTDGARKLLGLD